MSDNESKRNLPARASVEFLKKHAKRLLRRARRGEPSALARLARAGTGNNPRLADAQRAIAREHGHASWPRLLEAIRSQSLDFAMQQARFLARRYAASIGCSPHAIAALGRSTSPRGLVQELAPLCHRDVASVLASTDDPHAQLERLHDALREMIEGHWDLGLRPAELAEPAEPVDPDTAPAELVVVAEREPVGLLGRRYALRPTTTIVGRALACDVCLPVASVSRRHCTVHGDADGFAVRDEGSTNGVFVGSDPNPVAVAMLRHRDRVRIGQITLELRASARRR